MCQTVSYAAVKSSTNQAAAFCTRCRGANEDAGRLKNMELQWSRHENDQRHDNSTDTVLYLTQASQMVERRTDDLADVSLHG